MVILTTFTELSRRTLISCTNTTSIVVPSLFSKVIVTSHGVGRYQSTINRNLRLPPSFLPSTSDRTASTLYCLVHLQSRKCYTTETAKFPGGPTKEFIPDDSKSSAKILINRPTGQQEGVEIIYFRGLPQITIPLPSRREKCCFILKPLTNTVGDLLRMIQEEDKGIDRVTVMSVQDGVRIASSNTIEMLMEQNFNLVINDIIYPVYTPQQEKPSQEELDRLSSVRNLVGQLYAALNVDEHQLRLEKELKIELEKLQLELGPLEEKKAELLQLSTKKTTRLTWVGLGLMSVQFGILARLTWWEYSWDIMEPVTYFVTYGTAMLAYAYFVITKQDYVLPEVRDRQFLITFHKNARTLGLDVERYNELRTKVFKIEEDLKRLHDPLTPHLPLRSRFPILAELKSQSSEGSLGSLGSLQNLLSKAQKKIQEKFQGSSSL